MLGQLESEVFAGRMTKGDAIETLVQTLDVDGDELDEVRERMNRTAQEVKERNCEEAD
jgi:hypothetical protein